MLLYLQIEDHVLAQQFTASLLIKMVSVTAHPKFYCVSMPKMQ